MEDLRITVNGVDVVVDDPSASLLEVLREQLGHIDVKDGCAPQGQCGCCTVLVDGAPRVACVTAVRRIAGRQVTTATGLESAGSWADDFAATGATQCGFCTPGIIVRLEGLAQRDPDADHAAVEQALLAHVCRCTGWRTILDAWDRHTGPRPAADADADADAGTRSSGPAEARALLEGGTRQVVSGSVALGAGGFAIDTAPEGSLVAMLDAEGQWTLAESVAAARRQAGAVQGRRTTQEAIPPIAVPEGEWDVVLQTSWTDAAYLETDCSWCVPGGSPADPTANGGAFGAKTDSAVAAAARELCEGAGRPVTAVLRREDIVARGHKRPPLAAGLRSDGTGQVVVARTPGITEAIARALPLATVTEVDLLGPPTSSSPRGAGWAEATALAVALSRALAGSHPDSADTTVGPISGPDGGSVTVTVRADGSLALVVDAGQVLDEIVLRSYCIGAAHQALSLVTSEAIAVDDDGRVLDLTIRSLGVTRAVDTPAIDVEVTPSDGPPVAISDAVFAAVTAAVWIHQGTPPRWPTGIRLRQD